MHISGLNQIHSRCLQLLTSVKSIITKMTTTYKLIYFNLENVRGTECYITKLQKCSITVVKSYQGRKCYITAVKWYQCREWLITAVKLYQGSKMFHCGRTKISRSKMKHHAAVKWYPGRKCQITVVKSIKVKNVPSRSTEISR